MYVMYVISLYGHRVLCFSEKERKEVSIIVLGNICSHNTRLHKPVSDWLETLPDRISGLNTKYMYVREIPIGHN